MTGIKSLRLNLLVGLLLPLAATFTLGIAAAYRHEMQMANLVTDRTLLASARSIAEAARADDGRLSALIPPAALGMFETSSRDLVYYRVTNRRGDLLAGYDELPAPSKPVHDFQYVYYSARFRDEPIRLVAVRQPVPSPRRVADVLVVVGETLHSRDAMVAALWQESTTGQAILVLIAWGLAWLMLRRILAPLVRLGHEVALRKPEQFEYLRIASVHDELRPFVTALNDYMRRLGDHLTAQRRFTANAAHQLRTPLTLLHTQVQYALNKATPEERDDVLRAIAATTDQMTHLITQLMALSRADERRPLQREVLDFAALTRHVLEKAVALAVARDVDLGFEDETYEGAAILGDPALLHEMIVNVVDNALRYTRPDGSVTVTVARDGEYCVLLVRDDGPGIPENERTLVFERFYRILSREAEGTGLGLAIVKEIVDRHQGTIELRDPPSGPGLIVEIRLPAALDVRPRSSAGTFAEGRRAPLE